MKTRLRFLFTLLVVLAVGLIATPLAQAQNIVLNPAFDLNTPPPGTAPMDWTLNNAASGSDFFVGPMPTFGALSPPNSANFGAVGNLDDVLFQVLTTTAGRSYTLDFWLSHDSTNSSNDFSAWWDGTPLLSLVNTASFNWTEYTYTVVGTGSDTLTFSGREVPAWYGVDNVSVTPTVPEPGTLILMGSGLLGLAGVVRRKIGI
jgi:PEP-CTERM motif